MYATSLPKACAQTETMKRQTANQFFPFIFSFAGLPGSWTESFLFNKKEELEPHPKFLTWRVASKRTLIMHACMMNVLLLTGSKRTLSTHACIINVFCIDGQHKHINYARVHNQRRSADSQQHPSTFINIIKAKAGEGSCVASSPEIGPQEHDHCGAGT